MCYYEYTLCTAYNLQYKLIRPLTLVKESGRNMAVEFIHPRDSSCLYWFVGVFFFLENVSYLIPTYISAIELSYLFGGNEYGNK